jgi:LAO/AO transport system kinase
VSLLEHLLSGDAVALARVISHIENRGPETDRILAELYPKTGGALSIGVTGPPGSGKSTMVDKLCALLTARGQTVGVIAVDPTSPFTGGALLGDRIRMQDLAANKDVFIRSMASRGSTGGLAVATSEVIKVLDAFGKDIILVETVGVGQVELDVAEACDMTVVVLVPESGDSVQALKAGLMEIADIFCVNKADREGANRIVAELNMIMDIKRERTKKEIPVLPLQAVNNVGLDLLLEKIDAEWEALKTGDNYEKHRKRKIRYDIMKTVENRFKDLMRENILPDDKLAKYVDEIFDGRGNPYDLARRIMDDLK